MANADEQGAELLLRAGQGDSQALGDLVAVDPTWAPRRLGYPVLAMAHYHLGQLAEARQALADATRSVDEWTQQPYGKQESSWLIHRGATASWPVSWWDWLECRHYYREANLLIEGSPPPDNPTVHVLRARAFAGLRLPDQAEVEYALVLKQWPRYPRIQHEVHFNRAQRFIHRKDWPQAALEFTRACELQPDSASLWCHRALAHLAAGDLESYRQACGAMMERFQTTDDARTAADVLFACGARDDALADRGRLLPLARIAVATWHFGYHARGAALCRAGQFEEAIRCFEAEAQTYQPRTWDWAFLAMAHQRLGHDAEARRCLAEAASWIDRANHEELDDLTGIRPAWGSWYEPFLYERLVHEAKERVECGRAD